MELDYYLWKNKILHKDFAKKVGIATHTLSVIVNKKRTPSLMIAMKIHYETKGVVSLYELLQLSDREILDKMYSIVKKESIYKDDSVPNGPVIDLTTGGKKESGNDERL